MIVDILAAARPYVIKIAIEKFMQNKVSISEFNKFGKGFILSVTQMGIIYIIISIIENIMAFWVEKTTAVVSEKALNNSNEYMLSQKACVLT